MLACWLNGAATSQTGELMPRGAKPRVQLDMPVVLARIARGEPVAHIAREVGLTQQTLDVRVKRYPGGSQAISKGKQTRAAILSRSLSKSVRQTLKALEKGREADLTVLARARADLRLGRWAGLGMKSRMCHAAMAYQDSMSVSSTQHGPTQSST